ncbi:hypothetical protein [Streptomyces sp. NPDC005244]
MITGEAPEFEGDEKLSPATLLKPNAVETVHLSDHGMMVPEGMARRLPG